MSTPPMAKTLGLDEKHFEFGRYIECKIFGRAVNWIKSGMTVSKPKVVEITASVRNNIPLPDYKSHFMERTTERLGSPFPVPFDIQVDVEMF